MFVTLLKGIIAGAIIVAVTEIGPKYPRIGGLLLTLPLISILAFVMAWTKQGDLPAISALAKETLILVPLGLPFFIPLAFASRLNLGFWSAIGSGLLLATITIAIYFWMSSPASE
jgi:hypothetical protein